jgi:hypothetical protein
MSENRIDSSIQNLNEVIFGFTVKVTTVSYSNKRNDWFWARFTQSDVGILHALLCKGRPWNHR